ncbi:stage III sporulation protein AA [Actinomycetes bacterium NPDC127524]
METILAVLPKSISTEFEKIPAHEAQRAEELRIRVGRPLEVIIGGRPTFLPYLVSAADAEQLLGHLSRFSMYTLEEELKRGYVTIAGGHRVGLAGKVILENGMVKAIREVASFNIRIAKQKIGSADKLLPFLYDREWHHTMIIGAPQTGKTTLLRDIARMISSGSAKDSLLPQKVGIVDERSEIAGCVNGVPQLQFGPRVDILDSCPKAEGMMMLIRSMSPDVLVADEIGRAEDTSAVLEAVNAGIKLMITTHGRSLAEVKRRPHIGKILEQDIFTRYILLSIKDGERFCQVLDSSGNMIHSGKSVMACLKSSEL